MKVMENLRITIQKMGDDIIIQTIMASVIRIFTAQDKKACPIQIFSLVTCSVIFFFLI